jgi:hypothetical protein
MSKLLDSRRQMQLMQKGHHGGQRTDGSGGASAPDGD